MKKTALLLLAFALLHVQDMRGQSPSTETLQREMTDLKTKFKSYSEEMDRLMKSYKSYSFTYSTDATVPDMDKRIKELETTAKILDKKLGEAERKLSDMDSRMRNAEKKLSELANKIR